MALINRLEPDAVTERLTTWLPEAVPGVADVVVSGVEISEASGMSSESVLLEASWTRDGEPETRGLVARVAPESGGLFRSYDLGREARVMNALARATGAPVPVVLAHEASGDVLGAPFLVVERAYGQVPADDPPFPVAGWVTELSDGQRAAMFDAAVGVLAALAGPSPEELGLADLAQAELGDTHLDQQLRYWEDFYAWACQGTPSPTIDAALAWLREHRPPQPSPSVVSWGDARFGNLMFDDRQRVTGVFDWEMAALCPRETDLGYFVFLNRVYSDGMNLPALGGFPDREATIARWEELTGGEARDVAFYEAFGGMRSATMVMRAGRQLIELGALPADAAMPLANPATFALAQLLDLPAPGEAADWITGHR